MLDGVFAVVAYQVVLHRTTATRIFQSVAAGILGQSSYQDGTATALFGVLCHITVALAWTTAYLVISHRLTSVREFTKSNFGTAIVGPLYGAVMWLGMNYVVIPLSAIGSATPATSWQFWLQLVWHMIALGPPIVRILR